MNVGWHISWWVALGLILAFLPYFPYTKHAHLFIGPFNYMTRPERRALGEQEAIDFEDESVEQFGVSFLTDLSQTQLVDPFACIMCNRCQEVCPAYTTGKELSPAALEINKRYYIWENMNQLAAGEDASTPLLDFAISESAVWACTTCAACVDICPVGNEPMFDILDMRRHQVLMESSFPAELKGAFTGIERNANPWQMSEDRLAWANRSILTYRRWPIIPNSRCCTGSGVPEPSTPTLRKSPGPQPQSCMLPGLIMPFSAMTKPAPAIRRGGPE